PTQDVIAVIKVDADFSTIDKTCSGIEIGEHSGLVLLNSEGQNAYSSVSISVADAVAAVGSNLKLQREATLDGEKYLINSVSIAKPNWTIYCLTSFRDINAEARSTRNLTLVIALLMAALAFVIIYVFLHRFLSPLYEIMDKIKEIGKGNFNISFPADRLDEVGMLGVSMNEVVSQLDSIMKENSVLTNRMLYSMLVEKEAQVNMLYSQIQPHFIYNTLNMISISVQIGNCTEAVLMINKLSKLMRSMSKSDSLHTLGAELELLRDYLDIQKRRYGNRLDYVIAVQPELDNVEIPTLLLQPIAENAVVHGCGHERTKTTISVTVEADESVVYITIHNNGRGIDSCALADIMEKANRTASEKSDASYKHGGTGLRNVNQRLKIRYGNDYGIRIESAPNEGTTVILKVPR
ncbi:MAG: sensor histidine kinase, partial [Angelakisella sp.]